MGMKTMTEPSNAPIETPEEPLKSASEAKTERRADRSKVKSGKRSGLRTVFGVLSGVGIVVVAGAVVAAGTIAPGNSASVAIEPQSANLPAGQSISHCPGPAQLPQGSSDGTDPQFSPASTTAKTQISALVSANPQAILPNSALTQLDPGSTMLSSISQQPAEVPTPEPGSAPSPGKAAILGSFDVSGPTVLRADPVAKQRTPAAAVQVYTSNDGDLRGLAAASCQVPANDLWLVGTSTDIGRTAILTLANSSATAATVNLDLFGSNGVVQAAGGKGLLVPAGSSRSIVLAGLAAGQKDLAVHAKSNGGPVSAVIQQSVLRGLTPGGVDYLTPVAAPNQAQVITGVQTLDPTVASDIAGQAGYQDAQTALQVAVPGASDSVVQVQVFSQGGQANLPNGGVFTAKAGSVTELPLSGLPAGTYTVQVSAQTAITATVRSVRGSKAADPVDIANAGASLKLTDNQLLVLPAGAPSKISFGAPAGKGQLSLTPIGTDGTFQPAKSLDVPGGSTVVVDPAQLSGGPVLGFLVSASGDPVYGAQVLSQTDGNGLAILGLPRSAPSAQSLKVALGY